MGVILSLDPETVKGMEIPAMNPWVGDEYLEPKSLKYRTLILGESNYTAAGNFHLDLVIECVRCHLGANDDDNFSRFATKIRRVIFGPTPVSKEQFWHSVAFFNFLQVRVGDDARIRPTDEMWEKSVPNFQTSLKRLRPERMLVLGIQTWNQLRQMVPWSEEDGDYIRIEYPGGQVVAGHIQHPSSSLSYAKWGPRASALLCPDTTDCHPGAPTV